MNLNIHLISERVSKKFDDIFEPLFGYFFGTFILSTGLSCLWATWITRIELLPAILESMLLEVIGVSAILIGWSVIKWQYKKNTNPNQEPEANT